MLYGAFLFGLLLNSACQSWTSPTPQDRALGHIEIDPLPAPLTYELQFTEFSVPEVSLSKLAVCFACLYGILHSAGFAPTDPALYDRTYDLTNASTVVETKPEGKSIQLKDRIWAFESIIRTLGVGGSNDLSFPARSFWYGPKHGQGDLIRGELLFDSTAPGSVPIASDGNVTALRTRDDGISDQSAKLLGETLLHPQYYEDPALLSPMSVILIAIRALKAVAIFKSDEEIPNSGISFRFAIPGSPALVYSIFPQPLVGSRPVFWSTVGTLTLQLLEWIRMENEKKKGDGSAWMECLAVAEWAEERVSIPFAVMYLTLENRPLLKEAGGLVAGGEDDAAFFTAAN